MSELATAAATIILGLLGVFFLERKKRSNIENKLEEALFDKSDSILSYRQDDLSKKIAEEHKRLSELEKKQIEHLSPEEVQKYWQERFKK